MSSSPSKPLSFNSPRASPFRRPESPLTRSPSTVRAGTPSTSPTKASATTSNASPTKPLSPSLSPEKHNPFVRRPSQLGPAGPRPTSPFARPSSRLSVVESPSRALSFSNEKPLSPSDRESTAPASPSQPGAKTPTLGTPIFMDGISSSPQFAPSPSPSPSPSPARPALATRPSAQRTVTSSTNATVRPFSLKQTTATNTTTNNNNNATTSSYKPAATRTRQATLAIAGGNYNHIPQPLLRSMRESFEVLDNANSGTVNAANLAEMLDQLGMDSSPRALSAFFPPNAPANLNLSRYLDTLSAAHADLSHPDELAAAFGAFDVDDSGQIDLAELRDALLHTAPEPGAEHLRMSEAEINAIMADFSSRRAFGAKGVFGKDFGGGAGGGGTKGRSDVFRYRDFMASVSGGGGSGGAEDMASDQVQVA